MLRDKKGGTSKGMEEQKEQNPDPNTQGTASNTQKS